ncbi:MAG: AAA domain-containing protein, partial [Candidatus Hermodarchaeota archaeon]
NIIEEKNLEDKTSNFRYQFNKAEFLNQISKILGCLGGFIDYRCFFESYASEFFDTLPMDLDLVISPRIENILKHSNLDLIQFFCMKQNWKFKYFKLKNKSFYKEENKVKPWVEHLSWRLKRLYELRHQANTEENEGLYAMRDEEIESLLPKWNLSETNDLNKLDSKNIFTVINAIRIKAHNLESENDWNQKRNIKQQFSILLSNINDVSSFFNTYQTLLDSSNNKLDKTYLFEELIWFIIKKKSKEWILEFNKRYPDFFKDLLTYEIGNNVYDTLRIEFPSIIELLQEGLMVEPKYRNTSIYRCTVYKGYQAKQEYWETREKKLTYQHRMHPDISSFIRENFYAGKQVLDPDGSNNTYNITDERIFPYRTGPHNVWYDVKGKEIGGRSYRNIKEVEKIYEWYSGFEKWAMKNPKPKKKETENNFWEIAIITFYLGQEYELSNRFRNHFRDKIHKFNFKDDKNHIKLKICTVDSFQGQEADIVLLSFVKTKKVGFLDSRNRLNVALSRAKYYQVLFGNRNFFKSKLVERRAPILYILANYIPHISSLR